MKLYRFVMSFKLQADCPMCDTLLVWQDKQAWHFCSTQGVEVVFTREDW